MKKEYIEIEGKEYSRTWSDTFNRYTYEQKTKNGWRVLNKDRNAMLIMNIGLAFKNPNRKKW